MILNIPLNSQFVNVQREMVEHDKAQFMDMTGDLENSS